jgi:hypothetical protein
MNLYIDTLDGLHLKETLTFCGIINPIKEKFIVKPYTKQSHGLPFMVIKEGSIFTKDTLFKILENNNVKVIVDGETIVRKHSDTSLDITIIEDPDDYINLYDTQDSKKLESLLQDFEPENNDMVYYTNTEEYKPLQETYKKIVGVASGHMVARWAYESKIKEVEYYDYSFLSLKFQKSLITSNSVKDVYEKYIDILHTGQRKANEQDLENIDFDRIQKYYNYLKECNVNYGVCDIREEWQLKSLLSYCDNETALWISNIYYYASSINVDPTNLFNILDKSPAKVLPHTRVIYES